MSSLNNNKHRYQSFLLRTLLIFLSIVLFSFHPKTNYIKLIEASSQRWTSGIQGGGRGTEYYFKIKVLTNEKIDFDSAWIGNKVFKPYLANNKPVISDKPVTYQKNDTITVRISDLEN